MSGKSGRVSGNSNWKNNLVEMEKKYQSVSEVKIGTFFGGRRIGKYSYNDLLKIIDKRCGKSDFKDTEKVAGKALLEKLQGLDEVGNETLASATSMQKKWTNLKRWAAKFFNPSFKRDEVIKRIEAKVGIEPKVNSSTLPKTPLPVDSGSPHIFGLLEERKPKVQALSSEQVLQMINKGDAINAVCLSDDQVKELDFSKIKDLERVNHALVFLGRRFHLFTPNNLGYALRNRSVKESHVLLFNIAQLKKCIECGNWIVDQPLKEAIENRIDEFTLEDVEECLNYSNLIDSFKTNLESRKKELALKPNPTDQETDQRSVTIEIPQSTTPPSSPFQASTVVGSSNEQTEQTPEFETTPPSSTSSTSSQNPSTRPILDLSTTQAFADQYRLRERIKADEALKNSNFIYGPAEITGERANA